MDQTFVPVPLRRSSAAVTGLLLVVALLIAATALPASAAVFTNSATIAIQTN